MVAWLVGMPLIFWAIDAAQKLRGLFWLIVFMPGALCSMRLFVGAIHGFFLVRLAKLQQSTLSGSGSIISPF